MKRFYLASVSAGLALALMSGPLAMAQQDQHNNNGSEHNETQHGNQPNTHVQSHNVPTHNGSEHSEVQHGSQPNTHVESHGAPTENHGTSMENHGAPLAQHASSSRQWRSGDHYSGSRTVVSNWSHYHLHQPPSGYEWVQDSNQLVLIAVTSGVIASVIASQ
jgi:Ni/Co efflux regulator RcnB